MQAFKFTFQLSNYQLFTNEILWTFLSSQSKSEKAVDDARVILNEIHLSLFTAGLRRLFPHLFPSFDHFEVLLL